MATKAEKFKASAERKASIEHTKPAANGKASKKAPQTGDEDKKSARSAAQSAKPEGLGRKRPQDKPADTSLPGVAADDTKGGGDSTADRNRAVHAAKKATFVLEESETGQPSRKSTRRSENHIKAATNLQRRQIRATTSPKVRATKAAAAKNSGTKGTTNRGSGSVVKGKGAKG